MTALVVRAPCLSFKLSYLWHIRYHENVLDESQNGQGRLGKEKAAEKSTALQELGEGIPKVFEFWQVVIDDIRVAGVALDEVLVVALGRTKTVERHHRGHDWRVEDARGVQLPDVGFSGRLLLGVAIKDCGAVLRSDVRALTIELGWIVSHREKHFQQSPIAHPSC